MESLTKKKLATVIVGLFSLEKRRLKIAFKISIRYYHATGEVERMKMVPRIAAQNFILSNKVNESSGPLGDC